MITKLTDNVENAWIAEEEGRQAWEGYLKARFANNKVPKNPYPKGSFDAFLWKKAFEDASIEWFKK